MAEKELTKLLDEKNAALSNFRVQLTMGAADNVRAARNARRDIARILTIQRERQIAAGKKAK
jgi:large subunit ribosomal protein L29